ncbi:hypothetical protein BpHYR1_021768 [Brachionus plicatilis]|uniref:Uncharacterized protein n=1 Tax=Brachionus plicatilis TaxID=10195 RepID=A0A3M7QWJ4_BRAPC|nr:hypothetical protein BpHYR1_021768 [Brachionus plicatilis]
MRIIQNRIRERVSLLKLETIFLLRCALNMPFSDRLVPHLNKLPENVKFQIIFLVPLIFFWSTITQKINFDELLIFCFCSKNHNAIFFLIFVNSLHCSRTIG